MPAKTCWDEVHFGKFASYYINQEFYFDVHPPLAKMLIALAGWLSGYDGQFEFKAVGDLYHDVHYVGMRQVCALFGAACVPVTYLTVHFLVPHAPAAALLAASMVLLDSSCITLSRFILLDSILLFFILASMCCLFKFRSLPDSACFSSCWWFWLAMSGTMLGSAGSCKWVGFFIILFGGVVTAGDLWTRYGDCSHSLALIGKHFCARVLMLVLWPVILYLFYFKIHLIVLNGAGTGDMFMSSQFQSTLRGNKLFNATDPEFVAFGSLSIILSCINI